MHACFASLMVLAFLIPACGGQTPPVEKVSASPAAMPPPFPCQEVFPTTGLVHWVDMCHNVVTPASGVEAPLAASTENIPSPDNNVIDSADPNYLPRLLMGRHPEGWVCRCQGDDKIPWRTNIEIFDPEKLFSDTDQQRVFLAEKELLNATETEVPRDGRTGGIKQLNATINPSTEASVPGPGSAPVEPPRPSAEPGVAPPSAANNLPNVTDNDQRGNRRFGSRLSNEYEMTIDRQQELAIRRRANFNVEIFGSARTIANFEVNANLNCAPPLPPPTNPRRGSALTSLTVMGQSITPFNWTGHSGAFPSPGQGWAPIFTRPEFPAAPQMPGGGRLQRRNIVNRNALFFQARYRFMVGPVPMTVSAGVQGQVGLDVAGNLDCLGMSLDAIAGANLRLTAAWAINAIIIRAGINTNLHLVDAQLHAAASTRAQPLNGCVSWDASHGRLGTSLDGEVNLFTVVGFRWFQTQHDLNIARWRGAIWSEASHARDGQLCPRP